MENISYKLEQFEGPLDLLLTLIQKNKIEITDIPISLICEQYLAYIAEAQKMDMELAGEFIEMASRLMLIKSRMMLPRAEKETEDPREDLVLAVARYARAKALAEKLRERYKRFGGRMVKDTDELSPDRTFVLDQSPEKLYEAARRILAYKRSDKNDGKSNITPIVRRPIVPVGEKIVGILSHFKKRKSVSLEDMLNDARSRPELVAIFIGVLELIKQRHIIIVENEDEFSSLHGMTTVFEMNEETAAEEIDYTIYD